MDIQTNPIFDSLPNKPSALIRVALADLERAEKTEGFSVNMNAWHSFNERSGKREVCLGGAVAAFSLQEPPTQIFCFFDVNRAPTLRNKLMAINLFRIGGSYIASGLAMCNEELHANLTENITITPYSIHPAKFKSDMNNLADLFEKHGC